MRNSITIGLTVAALAHAPLQHLDMKAQAAGLSHPLVLRVPSRLAVETLLMDLNSDEGRVFLAQECEGEECDNDEVYPEEPADQPDSDRDPIGLPAAANLNTDSTKLLVKALRAANTTCTSTYLPIKYRLDCIRIFYLETANALPDNGDYRAIKHALLDGAAKLDAIVSANVEPDAPKITAPIGGKPAAPRTKPLRAVKPAAIPAAEAEAEKVITETSLLILRSGEDPARRIEHYTEVSAAVDSNLVILRSA